MNVTNVIIMIFIIISIAIDEISGTSIIWCNKINYFWEHLLSLLRFSEKFCSTTCRFIPLQYQPLIHSVMHPWLLYPILLACEYFMPQFDMEKCCSNAVWIAVSSAREWKQKWNGSPGNYMVLIYFCICWINQKPCSDGRFEFDWLLRTLW